MNNERGLNRFLEAQKNDFPIAELEIKNGRKVSHWMWYIFPQISGLGFSETSKFYAIEDLTEASLYLQHPILGERLINISKDLLNIEGKTATEIFGSPDEMKLKSCMTLFSSINNSDQVFQNILDKYFSGQQDFRTLDLIGNEG